MFILKKTSAKYANPVLVDIRTEKARTGLGRTWKSDVHVSSTHIQGKKERYKVEYLEEKPIDLRTKAGKEAYVLQEYAKGKSLRSIAKEQGWAPATPGNILKKANAKVPTQALLAIKDSNNRNKKKEHKKKPSESKKIGNMYQDVTGWNLGVGCDFECTYCKLSFQAQSKRRGSVKKQPKRPGCDSCYKYEFHLHPERMDRMPNPPKDHYIWPFQYSDIYWAKKPNEIKFIREAIAKTAEHPERIFFWQSKSPAVFEQYLGDFPPNTLIGTTLESDRDDIYNFPVQVQEKGSWKDYAKVSEAPIMSERHRQFLNLKWSRKTITLEPILDFNHDKFVDMILAIKPEIVWIGVNSKRDKIRGLPEPSQEKIERLIKSLEEAGINIRRKNFYDDFET